MPALYLSKQTVPLGMVRDTNARGMDSKDQFNRLGLSLVSSFSTPCLAEHDVGSAGRAPLTFEGTIKSCTVSQEPGLIRAPSYSVL